MGITIVGITIVGITIVGITMVGITIIGTTIIGITIIGITIIGITIIGITIVLYFLYFKKTMKMFFSFFPKMSYVPQTCQIPKCCMSTLKRTTIYTTPRSYLLLFTSSKVSKTLMPPTRESLDDLTWTSCSM